MLCFGNFGDVVRFGAEIDVAHVAVGIGPRHHQGRCVGGTFGSPLCNIVEAYWVCCVARTRV